MSDQHSRNSPKLKREPVNHPVPATVTSWNAAACTQRAMATQTGVLGNLQIIFSQLLTKSFYFAGFIKLLFQTLETHVFMNNNQDIPIFFFFILLSLIGWIVLRRCHVLSLSTGEVERRGKQPWRHGFDLFLRVSMHGLASRQKKCVVHWIFKVFSWAVASSTTGPKFNDLAYL